ncbi:YkvA family protein [Syntrophomonas curvata]
MNIESLKTRAQAMESDLGVIYLAFKHPRTPWYVKVLIVIVISYALSPIDLIPDFIPVLGYLDDLILIPAGIALAVKLIPDNIIAECRENSANSSGIQIKGIYAGIIIIALWLVVLYFVINAFW